MKPYWILVMILFYFLHVTCITVTSWLVFGILFQHFSILQYIQLPMPTHSSPMLTLALFLFAIISRIPPSNGKFGSDLGRRNADVLLVGRNAIHFARIIDLRIRSNALCALVFILYNADCCFAKLNGVRL